MRLSPAQHPFFRLAAAMLSALLGVLAAVPAYAQRDAQDALIPALEAVEDLRYQDALDLLDAVLARADLTADERNRALELEAACRVYMDDRQAALAGFAVLTRRDPGWSLAGDYPPRVRTVFEQAVTAALIPVDVRLEPVERLGQAGVAVRILAGADAVQRVTLEVRLPDGELSRQDFVDVGGTLQAPLPREVAGAGARVPYTVKAVAPSGFVLAERNGEWVPPELAPPPPPLPPPPPPPVVGPVLPPVEPPIVEEPPAWYESWWFWTIVGVAVVGSGTAAAVVLTTDTGGPRDGSGGSWEVW
jgi:hypothetical protein